MRFVIKPSARQHGIEDAEIRALISFPALRVSLVARRGDAEPVLFIGPAVVNQPWIEVIADLADPAVAEVFHRHDAAADRCAVHRRPNRPEYGPQRV